MSRLFKGLGAFANDLTGTKIVLVKCTLHFQLELNTVWFLNVPAEKKSKGLCQHVVGLFADVY
jgi:hypothetical protein